jgi:hypothetical protein
MIVIAIAEPLLSRILPPPLMAELRELDPVALVPSLGDTDSTRKTLAEAEILVTGGVLASSTPMFWRWRRDSAPLSTPPDR